MNNVATLTKLNYGERPARQFWLWWVVATALPASLAFAAANLGVYLSIVDDPEVALSDDNAIGPLFLFCGGVVFVVLVVALAQGQVLQYAGRFRRWGAWIAADIAGAFLAIIAIFLLGSLFPESNVSWLWVIMPGAAFGCVQMLALSPLVRKAAWWLPISWVAWAVAVLTGILASQLTRTLAPQLLGKWLNLYSFTHYDYPFYPPLAMLSWDVGFLVVALVFSALTGGGLVWLLGQRRRLTVESR